MAKNYVKCNICKKEMLEGSFNKHLEKHFDPCSRLCNMWYKYFFIVHRGMAVCIFCDNEINPDFKASRYEYEQHLEKEHNIKKPTSDNPVDVKEILREHYIKRLRDFMDYDEEDLTGGMVSCIKMLKEGNDFTDDNNFEFLKESLDEWCYA